MNTLVRKARITVILFAALGILISLGSIYLPLTRQLNGAMTENWTLLARTKSQSVHFFLDRSLEAAQSLSSRTAIRDLLQDYYGGTVTWEELKEFTDPRYLDGVGALDSVVLARRVSGGRVLSEMDTGRFPGLTRPGYSLPDHLSYGIVEDQGSRILMVSSPVRGESGILGHDVVYFDWEQTVRRLEEGYLSIRLVPKQERSRMEKYKILRDDGYFKVLDSGEELIYLEPLSGMERYLMIRADRQVIFRQMEGFLVRTLLLFGLGVLALFVVMNRITVRAARELLSELEASREDYKALASRDPLTGAYSRMYLDRWLTRENGPPAEETTRAVAMLDIDNFKYINDVYGHQQGDRILVETVRALTGVLGAGGFVVRYGGDELLVIGENLSPGELEDKVLEAQDRMNRTTGLPEEVRLSYGVISLQQEDFFLQLREADRKMYVMKRRRKGLPWEENRL